MKMVTKDKMATGEEFSEFFKSNGFKVTEKNKDLMVKSNQKHSAERKEVNYFVTGHIEMRNLDRKFTLVCMARDINIETALLFLTSSDKVVCGFIGC